MFNVYCLLFIVYCLLLVLFVVVYTICNETYMPLYA